MYLKALVGFLGFLARVLLNKTRVWARASRPQLEIVSVELSIDNE